MDYRKFGDTYYIRVDRGDEIVGTLLEICRKEGIRSATYEGIGGCAWAEIQTLVPEKGGFETQRLEGTLELVSLIGNVISEQDGTLYHHTHALFSYLEAGEHRHAAGHLKATAVRYTAEITLRPVQGGTIFRQYDPETGTGFWKLH